MTWFPSNNHPTDKATFTIRITVPEHLTAASNGLLVDEIVLNGYVVPSTWQIRRSDGAVLGSGVCRRI